MSLQVLRSYRHQLRLQHLGTKDSVARPEDIRTTARAARRSLGTEERHAADVAIGAALVEVLRDHQPGALAIYLPTDGEVDLSVVADRLRAQGWRLLLPVVGASATMHFARWDEGDELLPNRYGIAEPWQSDPVPVTDLDVVVLPCVAVDRDGHRLGFGAGFYDRALADAPDVLRIGVAYAVQVVEQIDPRPWDLPLDTLLTEREVLQRDERR